MIRLGSPSMPLILFVCVENRNRSVVCEYRLRQIVKDREDLKNMNIVIASAGTGFLPYDINRVSSAVGNPVSNVLFGLPPFKYSIESMMRRGIDISQHKSRKLNKNDVDKSNLIIVFADVYKKYILDNYPSSEGKIFTLQELSGYKGYLTNTIIPEGCIKLDVKTGEWEFTEWYLEACITEVEHMLWWSVDKIIGLLKKSN